ncbi:MAG: hypothetical protein ACXVHS_06535 [Methanobacterium sp.]
MNVFKINKRIAFIAYILLDTLFVGLGMGVPFFCILFGFPVGWYLSKRLTLSKRSSNQILSKILKYGLFTGMVTFILMIIIWIPFSSMLLDPNANFRNFGIPMILYDPRMSFIGWMILMIIISPFLQLLTTIFASNVTLWRISKKNR